MTPTRRTPRRGIAFAFLAAAAAAVCLTSLLVPRGPGEPPVSWGASGTSAGADAQLRAGGPFTISGGPSVALAPGATAPIDLMVQNTTDQDLRVGSLTVSISKIDAPAATTALPCGRDDFVVEQSSSDLVLVLRAGERRTLSNAGRAPSALPRITMTDSAANQDGCKDAVVRLRYAATSTET
jgi:hypothetical protein